MWQPAHSMMSSPRTSNGSRSRRSSPAQSPSQDGSDTATADDLPTFVSVLTRITMHLSATPGTSVLTVFKKYDSDGSGELDPAELLNALRDLGLPLTLEEVQQAVAEIDCDGDGTVSIKEFLSLLNYRVRRFASAAPAVFFSAAGSVGPLVCCCVCVCACLW